MRISIIGCGYVGTVTGVCFADFGHDIVFYDVDKRKLDLLARGESPIYEPSLDDLIRKNRQRLVTTSDLTAAVRDTDITFICVGTPSRDDGSIDLTYILSAGATIGKALRETPDFHPVIVKSTVFPGSTEGSIRSALEEASGKQAFVDFGLGSNPEFLREGNAIHDFCVPDRIVLGAGDARTMRALGDLYASFTCPKIETSIRTAEMIKYTSNAFLATKISFANEIGNLAKKLGIDAEEVFAGVGLDNRIGPAFFRTGIGFGGSCFPKDVRALIAGAGDHHENLQILHAALRVNEDQPLKLVRLLQAHIPDLKGRRIGILGLAFKPDTDDIRESRAIPVIRALLDAGAVVVAYDPLAMEGFSKIFPEIEYAPSAQAVLAADAVLITTEWEEFERLNYSGTTVIDGRRIAAASKTADVYEGGMLVTDVRKAVIPAAGLGTRFLPATKSMPKEMLPLIDRPVIQYVVEEAIDSGIEDLIIVTGRGKRAIEDYFDDSPELEMHLRDHGKFETLKMVQDVSSLVDIHYIRQKEPRGLGDAIMRAEKHIGDEPFAVLLGDDIIRNHIPCTKQLIDLYREKQRSVIAVEAVPREKISSYGIIRGEQVNPSLYRIIDIVEKPRVEEAPSNIGAIGRYVFTPEIFECLEHTTPGVGGEIQLTDGIQLLLQFQEIYAHAFQGKRYDTGDKAGYIQAIIDFALENPETCDSVSRHLASLESRARFESLSGREAASGTTVDPSENYQ